MLARNTPQAPAPVPCRRGLPLALVVFLLVSACGGPAKGPESVSSPGEWRSFEGTGSATGHADTLRMGPDRKVYIWKLSGSLLLIGEQRLGAGFRIDVIGTTDSLKGSTGWCVWTDTPGDQVFSEIRGSRIGTGTRIHGTLLGGTGRYAGATGEYEFEWQYFIESGNGAIQGRITGLRGRFRRDTPSAPPERRGSRRKDGSVHEPS